MPQPFELCNDLDQLSVKERLNYVLGQVLGVKDFQQEQAYFLHKSRRHNRSLHGYGTVWGLEVAVETDDDAVEIQVFPGLAIDPVGREICIEALQCARLDRWLEEEGNLERLRLAQEEGGGGGGERFSVYVVLCYRTCLTEPQPILGNPCRTDSGEEGVIQYTRIRDDFELKLLVEPPDQAEEDYVRAMGSLLTRVEVDPSADNSEEAIATLTERLRTAIDDPTSVPDSETFILPESESRRILRELFRYWVTLTRPGLETTADSEDDCCLLLASVEFVLNGDLIDLETPPVVVNRQRPYLLHTRLLQELLLGGGPRGPRGEAGEAATVAIGTVSTGPPGSDAEVTNSGTNTSAVLDFTLPQGPAGTVGNAATIAVGSVTAGAPGSNAQVTNSGTNTDAVFDFVIPRGLPGTGGGGNAQQVFQQTFRPMDMLIVASQDRLVIDPVGQLPNPVRPVTFRGYPALTFTAQGGTASFSTLSPPGLRDRVPPRLRLYCTAEGVRVNWQVLWRWLPALPAVAGPPRGTGDSLLSNRFNPGGIAMTFDEDGPHLHVNREPLELEQTVEASDYLVVYLVLPEGALANANPPELHLLMAELIWGEER